MAAKAGRRTTTPTTVTPTLTLTLTTVRRFFVVSALTFGALTAPTALGALGALAGADAFAAASTPATATGTGTGTGRATAPLARGAADRVVTRLASNAPTSPGPSPYVLLRHDGLIASLLDGVL